MKSAGGRPFHPKSFFSRLLIRKPSKEAPPCTLHLFGSPPPPARPPPLPVFVSPQDIVQICPEAPKEMTESLYRASRRIELSLIDPIGSSFPPPGHRRGTLTPPPPPPLRRPPRVIWFSPSTPLPHTVSFSLGDGRTSSLEPAKPSLPFHLLPGSPADRRSAVYYESVQRLTPPGPFSLLLTPFHESFPPLFPPIELVFFRNTYHKGPPFCLAPIFG